MKQPSPRVRPTCCIFHRGMMSYRTSSDPEPCKNLLPSPFSNLLKGRFLAHCSPCVPMTEYDTIILRSDFIDADAKPAPSRRQADRLLVTTQPHSHLQSTLCTDALPFVSSASSHTLCCWLSTSKIRGPRRSNECWEILRARLVA